MSDSIYDYYQKLVRKSDDDFHINSMVAVILPLTGKYSKVGLEVLDGLKYAEETRTSSDSRLSMIVYDNEGDELRTLEIFKEISNNPNISAIIGPISTSNSIIACSSAEEVGIPIILPHISQDGIADLADNIFLVNSNVRSRAELAAKFIAEELEAENVAVLAPADKFGKSIVDTFVERLKLFDITPLMVEWYSGVPTNLDQQFSSLRNLTWELETKVDNSDTLSALADTLGFIKDQYTKMMTEDDSAGVTLDGLDAIFIPTHPSHLNYISTQFPAYNLETTIIGNDSWTNLDLLRKENIGPHLVDMVTITNFNFHHLTELNKSMNENYSGHFYKAIDCYNLLANSVSNAKITSKSLQTILSNVSNFKGIIGTYNFKDNLYNVNSNLNILLFDGYQFNEYFDTLYPIEY